MQYNYSKEMFSGRTKPFRIIGDPDNQFPDKWSFTVMDKKRVTAMSSGI